MGTRRHRDTPCGIDDEAIEYVRERLVRGKAVRQSVGCDGFIHIDRQLPFMVLYRRPETWRDEGTANLVRGEASYLIASNASSARQGLAKLVRAVIGALGSRNDAFLVIELWSARHGGPIERRNEDGHPSRPAFRIMASNRRPPTATIDALAKALRSIRVNKQRAHVEVQLEHGRTPRSLKPLLTVSDAGKLNCYFIGLEVEPCFRDSMTGELYPLVLRSLHRGFSRSLRMAFFEFANTMTTYRPANYHVFGRRAVVRAVREVDRKLAEISQAFDLILLVTPINIEKAWFQFRNSRFEKMPMLYYRPLSVDPAVMKGRLFRIGLESVEDPTLALLFRQKRQELDRRLSMLLDRGKREFLYGSMQLFGGVDEPLKSAALEILERIPPHAHDEPMKHFASAVDLAARAGEVLAEYRSMHDGMTASIEIRDDILGLMVSSGNLFIGKDSRVSEGRVDALIHHEVSTHILTYHNGYSQPFHQLYCGLAGYDGLQEGLAVLAEYLSGGFSRNRLRLLAGRVIAAHQLTEGASFVETYRRLNRGYGFNQRTAFTIAIRIYRGGGLTKDAVYLRGLIELLDYLKTGGELDPLFVGKIAIEHIPLIRELQYREVLGPTPLTPLYLGRPGVNQKIQKLKKGLSPLDLVERR